MTIEQYYELFVAVCNARGLMLQCAVVDHDREQTDLIVCIVGERSSAQHHIRVNAHDADAAGYADAVRRAVDRFINAT